MDCEQAFLVFLLGVTSINSAGHDVRHPVSKFYLVPKVRGGDRDVVGCYGWGASQSRQGFIFVSSNRLGIRSTKFSPPLLQNMDPYFIFLVSLAMRKVKLLTIPWEIVIKRNIFLNAVVIKPNYVLAFFIGCSCDKEGFYSFGEFCKGCNPTHKVAVSKVSLVDIIDIYLINYLDIFLEIRYSLK